MEGKFVPSFDDKKIYVYEYNNVKNPKGVVQIIHGMAEHAGRYENIVNFLNKNGYIVFTCDHRAHGKTAEDIKNIGKYAGDIFYDTVRDQIYFSEALIEKYNLPLIVIGHSFGSFVAQRYNQLYNKHSALILSGSSYLKYDASIYAGHLVALLGTKIKGKNAPSKLITKLSFNKYNKQFSDKNWLTTDKEQQQKQKVDRFCNKTFSNNFYKSFFKGIKDIYKFKNIKGLQVQIPILLVSGKDDALGKNGELVTKLKNYYLKQGVNKVKLKLFEKARHEVFNEVDRQKVYEEILKFIEENIKVKEN